MEVGERRLAREGAAGLGIDGQSAPSSPEPAEPFSGLDESAGAPLLVTVEVWRRRYALRRALVDLTAPASDQTTVEARSSTAARAAVALAEVGDSEGLARILRPDPAVEPVAWTVACYEIGHLAPTALRDLSDPAEAVSLLVTCPEVSHLAAELVVSTSSGLRWTALVRSGSVLRLRLPSQGNASGESHVAGESATEAQGRWRDQLQSWAAESETDPPPARSSMDAAHLIDLAVASALEAAATVHAAEMAAAAIRHAAEMDAASTRHAAALEEARREAGPAPPVRLRSHETGRIGALLALVGDETLQPARLRRWAIPAARARVPSLLSSIRSSSTARWPHA